MIICSVSLSSQSNLVEGNRFKASDTADSKALWRSIKFPLLVYFLSPQTRENKSQGYVYSCLSSCWPFWSVSRPSGNHPKNGRWLYSIKLFFFYWLICLRFVLQIYHGTLDIIYHITNSCNNHLNSWLSSIWSNNGSLVCEVATMVCHRLSLYFVDALVETSWKSKRFYNIDYFVWR